MEFITKHRFFLFQVIGVIGGVLFIVSFIVRLATYSSVNVPEKYPSLVLLHIFLFILLGAVALFNKIEKKLEDEKFVSLVATQNEDEPNTDKSLLGFDIPRWLKILAIILGIYVTVNIIAGLTLEGNPAIIDGKYVLMNHGFVRELSRAEYDAATARSLRLFSGHWLLFYFFISTVSFLESFKKQSARHYEYQNKANFAELLFKGQSQKRPFLTHHKNTQKRLKSHTSLRRLDCRHISGQPRFCRLCETYVAPSRRRSKKSKPARRKRP